MYIAIIIGRKDSKGFPGKNLYPALGRPLSFYPMKAAKDCHYKLVRMSGGILFS